MMAKLDDLDEGKLLALDHLMVKKNKVERIYNKRVCLKSFKMGDLVWKLILPIRHKDHCLRKWSPNWEDPYICLRFYPEEHIT